MLSRELKVALRAPETWLAVAASALVSTTFAVMLVLPFVVARLGADHATARAAQQLGLRTTPARFVALLVVVALIVAPLALALRTQDAGSVATLAVGHLCAGVAVVGIGLFASALTSTRSAAALATLVVTAGAWALDAQRLPFTFATPTAALRVFERGLVDGKDVVTLLAGGLGLTVAAAMLLARTAPVERRVGRAGAALLVTMLACGAASQVRASVDLTQDQRASLAPETADALARIGDRVDVVIHMDRADPRVDALERDVLLPMRRSAKVRTRFAAAPAHATPGALLTWRVGGRERASDGVSRERNVPIVLELGGVWSGQDRPATPAPRATP